MARLTRSLAAVALAIVALLVLAACSGGGDGEDLTQGKTPEQILSESARAAAALGTFRLDARGEAETALSPAGRRALGGPASLIDGTIPFSGAGPVVQPDRFSFDVTAEPGGLPIQANLTRVGGDVYLSALGRDFALELPAAQVRRLDARQLFPSVAGWIRDPNNTGEEEIDGARTVRISGAVDAEAVSRDLAATLRVVPGITGGAAPSPEDLATRARRLRAQLAGSEVTIWVRTEDLLPARAQVRIGLPQAQVLAPELQSFRLDLTIDLSDYDEDLTVTAPEGAQPLSLDDLGGLLG